VLRSAGARSEAWGVTSQMTAAAARRIAPRRRSMLVRRRFMASLWSLVRVQIYTEFRFVSRSSAKNPNISLNTI
jgi:hypothetical protein